MCQILLLDVGGVIEPVDYKDPDILNGNLYVNYKQQNCVTPSLY